jgi:hypothetical protein
MDAQDQDVGSYRYNDYRTPNFFANVVSYIWK